MRLLPIRFLLVWRLLVPGLLGLAIASQLAAQVPVAASATGQASAPVRELEWYTAEVPVHSQESRERDAALGRALAQVLVRVTGVASAPVDPVLQRALRVAETMLVGSQYRVVEEITGGVPVQRQVLAASFDPDAVDALVMAAGLPLWSGQRPRPMLWLAIDDGAGTGPRLVSAPQITVVRPLAQRGLERGLRFLLPAGTIVEQSAVASIWALDPAAIGVLSGRYGARLQLLGKLARTTAGGWQAEWLLADGATELKRWSQADPSPQRAIASGADSSADALAARQAKVVAAGKDEVIDAEILGLDGHDRWLGLATYLQSLPVLHGYEVLEAQPDRLRVRLDLAVDRARFEALLASGDRLAVLPAANSDPADPSAASPLEPDRQVLARYRLLP